MTSLDSSVSNAPPIQADPLAPWRSPLSKALHRNRSQPFARYFQLATVMPDNHPANRTVVFRGFLAGTNQIMMISDRRSQKTKQIRQNPNAEACWYFTKSREQFRIAGQLALVTAETSDPSLLKARKQLWQNISDNARIQFAWPQPKAARDAEASADAFNPSPPNEKEPLETFCLLLLAPHSVDYLSLRGDPQTRRLYKKDSPQSTWQTATVNP